MHTPSPLNPLGAKGLGEAGCIGMPPAMVNAAVDALAPFGVTPPRHAADAGADLGGHRRAMTTGRLGGVALALLAAVVLEECWRTRLPLGTLANPGPAYMPVRRWRSRCWAPGRSSPRSDRAPTR